MVSVVLMNPECNGSTDFISQLIEKHKHSIRQFIIRRSGSAVLKKSSIDDIYQDSITAALSSAHTFIFVGERQFLGWIFTIVRRIISRTLGRDPEPNIIRIKQQASTGVGITENILRSTSRTPSSAVAERERKHKLAAALDTLPEHYQKVIKLYKLENHTLDDVSRVMDRSKGATARLIGRALDALRKKLIYDEIY